MLEVAAIFGKVSNKIGNNRPDGTFGKSESLSQLTFERYILLIPDRFGKLVKQTTTPAPHDLKMFRRARITKLPSLQK